VFENRVLSEINLDVRGTRRQGNGEDYIKRSFMVCISHQIFKSRRIRWVGHVARMGCGQVHTRFWLVN